MECDVITMQEIFTFERIGVDAQNRVVGNFRATGIRPYFAERFRVRGIELPMDLFDTQVVDGSPRLRVH